MIIQYKNEYEEILFNTTSDFVPLVGDSVVVDGNEYVVKSRLFYLRENGAIVILSEYIHSSSVAESKDNTRLAQLNAAIIQTNKQVDANEKKIRMVTEQVSTIRKHVNQQIKQNKKDTDEQTR